MKTQFNNSACLFNKTALIELNDQQLKDTVSGITPFVTGAMFGYVVVRDILNQDDCDCDCTCG